MAAGGEAPAPPTPQAVNGGVFPNYGMTLNYLSKLLGNPWMKQPMYSLPLVGPGGTLTVPLTLAALEALDTPALLELAQQYRVFSKMDGDAEFKR